MWKNVLYSACFLAAFAAQPARAEFSIKGDSQACIAGIKGDICRHFFGKDKVTVTYTPDTTSGDCPQVKAALVQVSSRIEAVVEDAGVTPPASKGCESAEFTVPLPAVANETEFAVVLQQQAGANEWKDVKFVSLKAYPDTLLDGVRSWAAFKDNALMVRDKDAKLGDFLDLHKVQYIVEDVAQKNAHKVYLVVTPDDQLDAPEKSDVEGDAVYFREKADILPVVEVEKTAQRTTVNVRMKLIDALAADDPLAQKMFAKIFNGISK